MATQLSIIRGDTFPTQTITVTSANLDFANITCTGQLRPHPDGNLLYTFVACWCLSAVHLDCVNLLSNAYIDGNPLWYNLSILSTHS